MSVAKNLELSKAIDDAFNSGNWDVFRKLHSEDVAVFKVGQSDPVIGRDIHEKEVKEWMKVFPDTRVHHPYKIAFGQGDWTCTVMDMTGTMKGPIKSPDGKTIPPTNKSFKIEICAILKWKNGQIVVEKELNDVAGVLGQIGLGQ